MRGTQYLTPEKMAWKAFVRTTRPSFYALVVLKYCARAIASLTGSSSHEELNRTEGIPFSGAQSYNGNPYSGMTLVWDSSAKCTGYRLIGFTKDACFRDGVVNVHHNILYINYFITLRWNGEKESLQAHHTSSPYFSMIYTYMSDVMCQEWSTSFFFAEVLHVSSMIPRPRTTVYLF